MSTMIIRPVSYNLWKSDKAAFAKAFGESFAETGFAVVSDHTIPASAIKSAAEQTKSFFALPREQKDRYADPEHGHQRGYSPIGSENAKGRKVSCKDQTAEHRLRAGNSRNRRRNIPLHCLERRI